MSGKEREERRATLAEGLRQIEKIVSALLVRSDSTPFREPVEWRQMNLPDYPEKVKKPMDLGTVRKLLAAGEYRTPAEAAEDVRRVWSNCKAYNPEGSELHELSVSLSKRFEDKYEKIPAHLRELEPAGGPGKDALPSGEEKRRFADNMYRIKMDQLSAVIAKLDQRCPEALEKVEGCDEIEINLDKIDARTFHEVARTVATYLPAPLHTKKAAASNGGSSGNSGGPKKKKRKKEETSSSSSYHAAAAAAAAAPSSSAAAAASSSSGSGVKEHSSSSSKHKKLKA